ncbi:MAG: glycosyltransferase family 2 protein [Microbacteriaceae bacterium]|nr:glycosyltransferase family 2 protein [Microbacteriaceae bacterium]
MTTISVVIPSLNDASMLKVCLDALAAQTRLPDEIVVVDNGSTDDTAEVARAAGARVITQPIRGIYPATSAGYDAATGDVIARLDADSIPAPDWVAQIEYGMSQVRPLTAITGAADFYGSNAVVRWLGKTLYIGGMYWSINILLGHPPVFGSNFAMPTQIWEQLRGTVNRTVTNIHDDLDLSYHFEPDMDIVYDRQLRVRISARPFRSPATLGRRLAWVYTTLSLDFAEQGPFSRRRARRRWLDEQDAIARDAAEPDGLVA